MSVMQYQYPLLSPVEQADLPRLTQAAVRLPSKFDDSTHQVWLCETDTGRMVLKVCDTASVAQSGFWRGLNDLFGADFPNSLGEMQHTHDVLTQQGACDVPTLVASQSNRFVLTQYMAGEDVEHLVITNEMVVQLATHISKLHQHHQATWGCLHAPQYTADSWGVRLQKTLRGLAQQSRVPIPETLLASVLAQAVKLKETQFVPLMLDLRWDQFRRAKATSKLALIDLDAFVLGPRALELVLLSYVLTAKQFALFKMTYCETHDWPDYSAQQQSYQLLLFLMQVLGEQDVAQWMRHRV